MRHISYILELIIWILCAQPYQSWIYGNC